MLYPELRELETSREMIDVFKGYNHNLRIGNGEFYDMTRYKRGLYLSPEKPLGMIAKDGLGYIDEGEFHLNQYSTTNLYLDIAGEADPTKTIMVSMGAYVIIITRKADGTPIDKVWVNSQDLTETGKIDYTFTTKSDTTFSMCKVDGSEYDNTVVSPSAPEITEEMIEEAKSNGTDLPLWIDTSATPHSLKQYSTSTSAWTTIATTYVKIASSGIGQDLSVNDGVNISGITIDQLSDLNNTMIIWAKGDDYIVVTGIIDEVSTQLFEDEEGEHPITITREMPNMDFIIESGNRLWGCRYGVARNGEVVNEIYASKLGDFKNWNSFAGISQDSYVASVGTDGQFTGAITHLGYPIFFKENYMHKVYGNYPSNYQIQTTACRGVQEGCSQSLAIVNETLYYKARSGICAYDGSLPVEVSNALGDISYYGAVAGTLGNKYYVSMAETDSDPVQYHLFVYDSAKGMWHREDNTQVVAYCNCRGNLYYIDDADGQIKTVRGSSTETETVKWEAVTGVIGTDSPDKKYISRIDVRLKLNPGDTVTFYVEYDSGEVWDHLFTMTGKSLRTFAIPIRPQRCDHLRLKIVGEGDVKIFSICKTIEQGSDV